MPFSLSWFSKEPPAPSPPSSALALERLIKAKRMQPSRISVSRWWGVQITFDLDPSEVEDTINIFSGLSNTHPSVTQSNYKRAAGGRSTYSIPHCVLKIVFPYEELDFLKIGLALSTKEFTPSEVRYC
jgi:hypothetical protein